MDNKEQFKLSKVIEACKKLDSPRVLELGTYRSQEGRSTLHDVWVPHASEYLGTDIEAGEDVDIVADAHRLSSFVGKESFDIIISCSTFEHFKYPQVAAHEMLKSLKVGGLLFVQTHQTFPLHAYPYDYFRFSAEALSSCFGTKMGFNVEKCAYEFPAKIHSEESPGIEKANCFLNVCLWGRKHSPTPDDYVFEWDTDLSPEGP